MDTFWIHLDTFWNILEYFWFKLVFMFFVNNLVAQNILGHLVQKRHWVICVDKK